jgi:hypothetical protein
MTCSAKRAAAGVERVVVCWAMCQQLQGCKLRTQAPLQWAAATAAYCHHGSFLCEHRSGVILKPCMPCPGPTLGDAPAAFAAVAATKAEPAARPTWSYSGTWPCCGHQCGCCTCYCSTISALAAAATAAATTSCCQTHLVVCRHVALLRPPVRVLHSLFQHNLRCSCCCSCYCCSQHQLLGPPGHKLAHGPAAATSAGAAPAILAQFLLLLLLLLLLPPPAAARPTWSYVGTWPCRGHQCGCCTCYSSRISALAAAAAATAAANTSCY